MPIQDVSKVRIGDKVCYQPSHYPPDRWENGMVKAVVGDCSLRVVYSCNGDWKNFKDYTGALTNTRDLTEGWKH